MKIHLIFLFLNMVTIPQILGQQDSSLQYPILFYNIVEGYHALENSDQSKENKDHSEVNEDVFGRWEWFWRNRVDKHGGFSKYADQMRLATTKQSNRLFAKSASSITWDPIGLTSIPLRYPSFSTSISSGLTQPTCIWADNTNVYIGVNGGSLWKRNGTSWDNLTETIPILGIRDIEVDSNGKIYLATGYDGQGSSRHTLDVFGFGVVFSADGGSTWTTNAMSSVPNDDLYMEKIIIHPTNESIVYALSRKTVYKSSNGGSTWQDTNAPMLQNSDIYTGMVMKENDPNTLFICSAGMEYGESQDIIHGSIFKTINGGANWGSTNIATELTNAIDTPHWLDLATTPDDAGCIYVVYRTDVFGGDTIENSTLEKSSDDGDNWTTIVDQDRLTTKNHMMHNMTISPSDKNNIYIGGVRHYKVDMISGEFVAIGTSLHNDLRDWYIYNTGSTDLIYMANDAGIYTSSNNGSSWTDISSGIHGSLFYSIAICESDPELLLGGVGDCGTHFYNGTTWYNMTLGGDGGTSLISNFDSENMFAQVNSYHYYTKDGGNDWDRVFTYIPDGDDPDTDPDMQYIRGAGYETPIIQHPTSDKVYISEFRGGWWGFVHVSIDKGITWTEYYDPREYQIGVGNDRIYAMAISESDPEYFYIGKLLYTVDPVGYYNHTASIIRTDDDGETWEDITPSNISSVLSEVLITDIEIHPENPNKIWMTFSGLSDGHKVYYSNDGGNSWNNVSYNLENLPAMAVEYDHHNSTLYLATDLGVFQLKDGESTWSRMGAFPHAITTDIKLNGGSGKLVASTWGNGLWETSLPGHCYDGSIESIVNTVTWSTDRELCNNLSIQYGGELTVNCSIIMPFDATITINYGAKLIVDGGNIDNANINTEYGGRVEIINGGVIHQSIGDDLNICDGCTLDISDGEITIVSD